MIDIKHTTDLDRSTSVTLNMICVNYIWLNLERGSPLSTPGKRIVLKLSTLKNCGSLTLIQVRLRPKV